MGARKVILTQGAVLCRLCSLTNFVREILHSVNLPLVRMVLSSSSGEPLEFQSESVLTRVEASLIPSLEADQYSCAQE